MIDEHFTLILDFYQAALNNNRFMNFLEFNDATSHDSKTGEVELSRFGDVMLDSKKTLVSFQIACA